MDKIYSRKLFIIFTIIVSGSILSGLAYGVSNGSIIVGDLTVTGSCIGCGGEHEFTSWSTILNGTISGTSGKQTMDISVSNDGSVLDLDQGSKISLVLVNGTVIFVTSTPNYNLAIPVFSQSSTGEYKIVETNTGIDVYKNNVHIQTLGLTLSQFKFGSLGNEGIAISPDGKYISIVGIDSSGTIDRIVTFEGS